MAQTGLNDAKYFTEVFPLVLDPNGGKGHDEALWHRGTPIEVRAI